MAGRDKYAFNIMGLFIVLTRSPSQGDSNTIIESKSSTQNPHYFSKYYYYWGEDGDFSSVWTTFVTN